jgi:glycosyltransferase involved in cell wall biosynthesis
VPATKLLVAGYLLDEHRPYLKEIENRVREWGLAGEYRYAGAPDRAGKLALLQEMDVFSVPAVYAEPKGLSLLEAMASGLPIVQPRRGAFTEIVERTGGGVLVAPDDPDALADALFALVTDRRRAGELGACGTENVRKHYSKERMAEAAERAYGEFLGTRPAAARSGARS